MKKLFGGISEAYTKIKRFIFGYIANPRVELSELQAIIAIVVLGLTLQTVEGRLVWGANDSTPVLSNYVNILLVSYILIVLGAVNFVYLIRDNIKIRKLFTIVRIAVWGFFYTISFNIHSAIPPILTTQLFMCVLNYMRLTRANLLRGLPTPGFSFKDMLEKSPDATIKTDVDTRITEWDGEAEKIFGWSREEAIGKTIAETIIPMRFVSSHNTGLEHFKKTGIGPILYKQTEIIALNKAGYEFPIELVIIPHDSGIHTTFIAIIKDITGKKRQERLLNDIYDKLRAYTKQLEKTNAELRASIKEGGNK